MAGVAAACTTSSTTTILPPFTGIEIPVNNLIAGIGCGVTDGASTDPMVYRYAVKVSYALDGASVTTLPTFSNIYDCFANGVFKNIPNGPPPNDILDFNVDVAAYDFATYEAVQPPLPSILSSVPGADAACPPSISVTDDQMNAAKWKARCTVTELAGVPVLAVCPPLVLVDGGMLAEDGETEAGPDATVPAEAEAPDTGTGPNGEASADAGADAAADANADAPAEPPDAGDTGDAAPDGPADG